jgi:hypothetical protein
VTPAERALLPSLIDKVVALETIQGDRLVAQLLFVFDEGETPDLFCLEVTQSPDGTWIQKGSAGYSILLSEIERIEFPVPQIPEPNQ